VIVPQVLLFIALHLVGVIVCLAAGPHRRPLLCAALGFPMGLAVTCLLALVSLVVGVPYGLTSVAVIMLGIAVAGGAIVARRGIDARSLRTVGMWTAGFAIVAALFSYLNLAIMSHDSFIFVMLGKAVGEHGLVPDVIVQLDEWGSFQVVAHSLAPLIGVSFLYGLPPVLGLSLIPVFVLVAWYGLAGQPRRRALAIALVAVAGFGNYMSLFHIFYLHTNMGSAVYLFCFVALFWLAEVEEDRALLPLAFVSLAAFALQRTETPLVAMIFVALIVPTSKLPRRWLTVGLAVFILIAGGWYEVLAQHLPAQGDFLTPSRCRMVWGAMLAFLGWYALGKYRLVALVNRSLPALIGGIFLVAVVVAFALRWDHMLESVRSWGINLFATPYWGGLWIGVVFLCVLSAFLPSPRFRHPFVIGVPVYFAFVLLLALFRAPYHAYVDDSANRMTIHILPVLLLYFALVVGAAWGSISKAGDPEKAF